MNLLEVSAIYKEENGKAILGKISFKQGASQNLAIAGESGAGKTTLLKIVAGLIQPDSGQVLFENAKVEGPFEKLIPGHSGIAYLSQYFELRNHYRVEEILEYANELPAVQAAALYKVCRIDHLLKRRTSELSGGEKQRIALARLLTSSPRLLLLDEPFSNLDLIHKNVLKSVIDEVSEKLNISCLITSHDPNDMLSWADEIMILRNGKIVQQATPENIYKYPTDEYVAGLFGRYNIVSGKMINAFPLLSENRTRTFLRPEDFKVVKNNNNSIRGTVNSVNYMGSYYEIEVALRDLILIVRSTSNIAKGKAISISPAF